MAPYIIEDQIKIFFECCDKHMEDDQMRKSKRLYIYMKICLIDNLHKDLV